MKSILVTGGAGFIGSNFIKHMRKTYNDCRLIIIDSLTYAGNLGTIAEDLKDGIHCVFKKISICDYSSIDSLFKEYQIDAIINFAAESHVDRSIENPQVFLETNILGTQTLLEIAKKSWTVGKDENGYPMYREGVKFLQISTDEVYGSLNETGHFTEKTPLDPRSPYSASKTGADLVVKAYQETYKLPTNITRCSNNYGPYQFPEKLIPLVIKNILEGKKIPVYGNGSNVRDWLYVEDHCKAIALVLFKGKNGEVYNVGGHNEMKNIDIVKLIIKIIFQKLTASPDLKKQLQATHGDINTDLINDDLITFVPDRLGHDLRYAIDPTKITSALGWKPETHFAEGIKKTVDWYLNNQTWVQEVTLGEYQHYYEKMYGK